MHRLEGYRKIERSPEQIKVREGRTALLPRPRVVNIRDTPHVRHSWHQKAKDFPGTAPQNQVYWPGNRDALKSSRKDGWIGKHHRELLGPFGRRLMVELGSAPHFGHRVDCRFAAAS